MKTVFVLLFLLMFGQLSIAQSKENYSSRNYKLNRNYLKDINSRKNWMTTYKAGENKIAERKLKGNHRMSTSQGSRKAGIKADRRNMYNTGKNKFHNQKSTLRGSNKKSGKQLASYFTMILAFSLILVNK